MSIEAHGIRKKFGAFTALDDVDLNVPQGKLVALLGPSGSGKTTLLRIIAGLEFPDPGSGRVLFHGEDVTDLPAGKRKVGFVFQHYALFRHMTVLENIAFGLRVRRAARPPVGRRDRASGSTGCSSSSSWTGSPGAFPRSFPAASASASPWRGRSRSSPRCCSSTSPSGRSTPRCARSCGAGCGASTTTSSSPPSS